MSDATDDLDMELSGVNAYFRSADKKHWEEQRKKMSAQPNDELVKDIEKVTIGLEIIIEKAERASHNFARSFESHPEGCVYCEKEDRTHTLQAQQYTRLEVIDHTDQGTGREYSKWVATPFTVKFDEQDDGRTLKIFLEDGVPSNE